MNNNYTKTMKKVYCHNCDSCVESIETSKAFHNNKILLNGIQAFKCKNCGYQVIDEKEAEKVLDALKRLGTDIEKPSKINQVIAML